MRRHDFASIAAILLLAGCTSLVDSGIVGTRWRAVEMVGVPIRAEAVAVLNLESDGRFLAGSCNHIAGTYQIEPKRISFRNDGATEMACIGNRIDEPYFAIIQAATSYHFAADGSLVIAASDGRTIHFRRKG